MLDEIAERRRELARRVLGANVRRLWCPPITHYRSGGQLDAQRMAAHWRTMSPHVGGFLVPGSTGDGWEMDAAEVASTLREATSVAADLNSRVLVGVLRTDVDAMLTVIDSTVSTLRRDTGSDDPIAAMEQSRVAAFTICPPAGAHLTQADLLAGLARVLDRGLPTALYQLPQVTRNEMSPETFRRLSSQYANLLMFKDTSGKDRVPMADGGRAGVLLVRGAEGASAPWLREAGGCYWGLLLSSANCFAKEYQQVIAMLEAGRLQQASALSERIAEVVTTVFAQVAGIEEGNAFANANKALDHVRAHGHAGCLDVPPPMLHAGDRLPVQTVRAARDALLAHGLAHRQGYLNS